MTDLVVASNKPGTMERIRRAYPAAQGYGRARGARFQVIRDLKIQERRGNMVPVWRFAKEIRPGVIDVPVVIMRTTTQVRTRKIRNGVLLAGVVVGAVVGVGALVWASRYVIGAAAGMTAVLFLWFRLASHWTRGCSGLHCTGCRG